MDELYSTTPEDILLDKEAEEIDDAENELIQNSTSDLNLIPGIQDDDLDELEDIEDSEEDDEDDIFEDDDDDYVDYEVNGDSEEDDEDEINVKIIDDIEYSNDEYDYEEE